MLEYARNLDCCFMVETASFVKAEIHLHALRQHKQVVAIVNPHFHVHMCA